MDWIVNHIPNDGLIFEIGCGCGANLIWLAQHGFHNLVGSNGSASAIAATERLADLAQQKISVRIAGGFVPSEGDVTALLAINCIYYAPID